MLTYVITGVTGYVGNVFAKKLMSLGHRVVGFARSEKKVARVFGDRQPAVVYGDICDRGAVEKLFEGEGEFIVLHTAATVTIGEGDMNAASRVTVEGTRNVVEACCAHNVKKLIHISSTEVIPDGLELDEDLKNYVPAPEKMREGYPRAKTQADEIVLNAAKERGLNASILMFVCVLGPGDYSLGHMSQLIVDFIEGRLPASVKSGYNNFDIRDAAEVLPAIVERSKKGESYIFATEPSQINDILRAVSAVTGRKLPPTLPLWVAYVGLPFLSLYAKVRKKRPLYTATALAAIKRNSNFPIGKTVREFGFSPRPLEETVADHVQFLTENGMVKRK